MVGRIGIQDVEKEFSRADGTSVRALNKVSLEIPGGSFVSLIGPSGCGKSTLLRLIAGLERPSGGGLFLDGAAITGPGFERGLVFQESNLFPWASIAENVSFGLKARGVFKEKRESVGEYIRMVGLEGFEKSFPHQLSGGMCQRASLARTLVGHPKVLLLDEPFGALDAFTRMNMQDELLRIKKENDMTMLMVTHDVDEAVYLSDKIVVMSARPSKVEEVIDVGLSRPRDRGNPEFVRLRGEILKILHFAGNEAQPEYYL